MEVEMLRKMDHFAVGDRFRGPQSVCARMVKLGYAKPVEETPSVEPEKKRRRRREQAVE